MFDGLQDYFGHEAKTSKNGTKYNILSISTDTDVIKLYCPSDVQIPAALKRGDKIEVTIDIDSYGKAIVKKIVK